MNGKANDVNLNELLEQVMVHLREQPVPEFPDPEIVLPTEADGKTVRPFSSRLVAAGRQTAAFSSAVLSNRLGNKTRFPRRLIVTTRIAASVMFVGGVVGLGLLLGLGGNSALAQTAAAIRNAKTCRFEISQAMQIENGPHAGQVQLKTTVYWKAPDSYRMEVQKDGKPFFVQIMFADKPGLRIDEQDKAYRRMPAGAGREVPMMKIIQLGRFSGKANRDLGDKKIDGVDTRGFEITMEKFDSKVPKGTLSAWISKETHLPVLVEVRVEAPQNIHVTMRKFAWNVELDDKLFDTTPPVGYADKTPEAKTRTEPDSAKFVEYIVTALRLYAKTFDGQYPRETMSHGYDTHALAKKLGITQGRVSDQIPPETVVEFSRACVGGSFIKRVLRVREYKPAKYYGGTVTPNDASKVLLYWKTNDGFQVIFGDLKSRKVSAEELKRLKP